MYCIHSGNCIYSSHSSVVALQRTTCHNTRALELLYILYIATKHYSITVKKYCDVRSKGVRRAALSPWPTAPQLQSLLKGLNAPPSFVDCATLLAVAALGSRLRHGKVQGFQD